MGEERERGPSSLDRLHDAITQAQEGEESISFIWGGTPLRADKDRQIGFEDPQKALASPSAIKDLNAAVNAADELRKATTSSPPK